MNLQGFILLRSRRTGQLLQFSLSLALLFLTLPALADNPFEISTNMQGKPLGLFFETLEDPKGILKLQDVLKIDASGGMIPSQKEVPNYGLNPSVQWVKFTLNNPLDRPISIILENKFTFADKFTLYFKNSVNQWESKAAGDQVAFSSRDVQTRQGVFLFTLEPGIHLFYASTKATGTHQLPLHIWTEAEFHQYNGIEYGIIGILIGFHVAICLYNMFLFFSLKDPTYLVYVAYVSCNLVYQASGLGLMQQLMSEFSLGETISNKIMIVSVDLIAITALLFSSMFLNIRKRLPGFVWIFIAIGVLDLINIFVTTAISVHLGTIICLITASLTTSVLILSGFLIARKGDLPAWFYLAAWGCYLLGVTATISNLIGLVPTSNFTRWGQFTGGAFELAILSLALGARINQKRKKQVNKITELNSALEYKVKVRTSEIQSLLLYIPQGILSITKEGLLGQKFSAQLPEILGHSAIAEQSFKTVILDRSTLTDDEKDQAWQALQTIIGESSLNFEINIDKLPLQLTYRFQSQEKVLRLTWNKELNDHDEVERVLVTLLDISKEVNVEKELQAKNFEFEMIRQLVEAGAKKSIQFFSSANQLIEENARLVHSGLLNMDTTKILFVNTHTIKGAARTLQLKDLANEFHKIESYYSALLKEQMAMDTARVVTEFELAQAVYRQYEKANRDILGRKDDLTKVAVDRDFLQENVHLLRHLADRHEIPFDLKEIIHKYRDELTNMIFMSLPSILSEIMGQAEKIAKDLGREPPVVEYNIEESLITYSQEMALKNAFIHLLRNALDHGIEPPKIRMEKGKKPFGTIQLKAYEIDNGIIIEMKDDGQGLAIGKIRAKGSLMSRLSPQASAQEISAEVFETGFSTSDTVSAISGRGVGLAAVRQFLEAEGGSATVLIGDPIDAERELYQFTIRLVLPSVSLIYQEITQAQSNAS